MTSAQPGRIPQSPGPAAVLAPDDARFLQEYVQRLSGIALGDDKRYLLESRLLPLVRSHGLKDLGQLCGVLRGGRDVALKQEVVEAMTTNETFFFRDAPQYDALRAGVIPALLAARLPAAQIAFWSAACSSGQEAYSLAIMLLEMGLGRRDVRILGTDLSEQILERARRGCYSQAEIGRGVSAAYLAKYFTKAAGEWQLRDDVRRMVSFEQQDLRYSMGDSGKFDVIFCRNVLIYFDVETKTRILHDLCAKLTLGGYLLLGNSETTLHLDVRLERRVIGEAVLYQTA